MNNTMKLPPGFVLDTPNQAPALGGALPEGFVLDRPTQLDALGKGIEQGATFGFSDELRALAAAGAPEFASPGQPETDAERQARELFGGERGLGPLARAGLGLAGLVRGNPATQRKYDDALAAERTAIKAAEQAHPWTALAGNVLGGIPTIAFGGPVTGVASAARAGAISGALYGAGTGEGAADRLGQAAAGGAIGGALGAGASALLGRLAPKAPAKNPVVEAGEALGVAIPRAVASESPLVQQAGEIGRNIPFVGRALVEAREALGTDITRAADDIAARLGKASSFEAGEAARNALVEWIGPKTREALSRAYGVVDQVMDPSVTTPLSHTRAAAAEILARRQASAAPGKSGAVDLVREALERPEGLTWAGMKDLRSIVREVTKRDILPDGIDGQELRAIYSALTDDLANAARNAGGAAGEAAYRKANQLAAKIAERRAELAKIVGLKADVPPERVYARLVDMASADGKGNIGLLAKAKAAIGDDWNEVSSALIANLGRDAEGMVTPNRFITAWGKLSDEAKKVLFDPTTRKSLDAINTIEQRLLQVAARQGNPSGTARMQSGIMMGPALGASAMAGPVPFLTAMGSVFVGAALSKLLSKPATAASAAKLARAYEMAVYRPAAGTIAGLRIAARNLANTANDAIGTRVVAEDILRGLSGLNTSAAQPDQKPSGR